MIARGASAEEPGEVGDEGVRVDGGEGVGACEGGTTGERIPRGLGVTEGGLGLSGRLPGTRRGESGRETAYDGPGLGGAGVPARDTCETRVSICWVTESMVLATSASSCSDGVGEGFGVGVKMTGWWFQYCHYWLVGCH